MEVATVGVNLDARNYLTNSKKVVGATNKMGNTVHQQTGKMKKSFSGLVAGMNPLRTALIGLTSAVSFGAVIRSASQFEKKMAEVSTLLNDTSGIDSMADSLDKLSRQFGTSAVDQAGALYTTISAGASSAAEAMETLDVANQLALGGVTDIGTAVDGLTTIMNAYGDAAGTATDISDSMFVAMRAGKTTIGEISGAIGKVAPLAVAAGVSVDELNASLATLTLGGISTRESVTGMRAVLAALTKVIPEAAEEAERLNLAWGPEAINNAGGFTKYLAEVVEKTGGSTESLAKLFGGVEAIIPVLSLAGTGFEKFNEIMEDMKQKGGETAKAVEKMQATFDYKWNQFTSSFSSMARSLGEALLPALTSVVNAMASGINFVRDFGSELALLAKIVATGGALFLGLSAQPLIYKAIFTWQTAVAGSTGLLTKAFTGLSAVLVASKAAWMIPITAVSTLTLAMQGLATFIIGWHIGKYLEKEFGFIEYAAIKVIGKFMEMIEVMKGMGGIAKAALTFDLSGVTKAFDDMLKGIAFQSLVTRDALDELMKKRGEIDVTTPTVYPVADPDLTGGGGGGGATGATDEMNTLQSRANDLLDEYVKRIALGSKATELQTLKYELMNGELAKLDPNMKNMLVATLESANAAAEAEQKLEDQSQAIVTLTSNMRGMIDQKNTLNMKTREEVAIYELTTEKFAALGDEFNNLKEQYIAMARELDNARFTEEARALEKALIPAERYADAIEHINELRDRGQLSSEAYTQAIYNEQLRSNEAARSMRDSFAGFFKDVIKGTDSIGEAFGNMIIGLGEKLTDAAMDNLADQFMQTLFPTIGPQGNNTLGIESLFGGASSTPPINPVGTAVSSTSPDTMQVMIEPTGSPVPVTMADQLENEMPESLEVMIEPSMKPVPVSIVSGGCCQATESMAKEIKNISQGARSSGNYSIDYGARDLDALGEADARITEDLTSALESSSSSFFDEFENGANNSWANVDDGFDDVISNVDQGFTGVITNLDSKISSIDTGSKDSGLGSLIQSVFGIFTKTPGASHGASFKVPGYAHSGDFRVGGSGGIDSQVVAFRATPNETVTVTRPEDRERDRSNNIIVNVTVSNEVTRKTARQAGIDIGAQISRAQRGI